MLQPKPTGAELKRYVSLGDVARGRLGMQAQYASRYVDGAHADYPDLASDPVYGEPLRVFGDDGNYHSYMIHGDDADEFVRRVSSFRSALL